MGDSLKEIRDLIVAKGGYLNTALNGCLKDLKNILDDQYSVRTTAPTQCPSNTQFNNLTTLSLGQIRAKLTAIKMLTCSCQNQTAYCACNTQTCTCNTVNTCTCNQVSSCTCNTNNGTCYCNTDSGSSCGYHFLGCICDYLGYDCSCDAEMCSSYWIDGCGTNMSGGCGSEYTYTSTYSSSSTYNCTSNSTPATCPCNALYNS